MESALHFGFLVCLAMGAAANAKDASVIQVAIDTRKVLHEMNSLYMGCHSDSGFVHEVTGWSSQMLFGESFERPPNTTTPGQSSYAWQQVIDPQLEARAEIVSDPTRMFSGWPSQKIQIAAGPVNGAAGLANRGLGNEGLYFRADLEYEGYFFASSSAPVALEVRLETTDGQVLAKQRVQHVPPTGNASQFLQHTFTLTPTRGTECVGIEPNSDPTVHCTNNPGTAHVCIKCGGQFTVALVGSEDNDVEVNIAYVVLQPGPWGRFKGLNARKDVAEMLLAMGTKVIRLGGSFISVTDDSGEYYQWQKWTGPVWERPSIGAHWDSYDGNSYNLIGGWGPFEMIDYAAALGADPIITTTMTSTPESLADLVEYCWGDTSTAMGRQRVADGHPELYRLKFIELGNEQYNPNYIDQIIAMEERAKEVGVENQLYYIFPDNHGVTGDDVARAAKLKLGARLVTDLHVGAGGSLAVSDTLFATHATGGLVDDSAVNLETNAGTHDLERALDEAADLNAFFNAGAERMLARTASFCHGRAGHFDMFDQAISFFLPNMTWLQPPGHVHAMITASWKPHVLNTSVTISNPPIPQWSTLQNETYQCSSSEYRGSLGGASPAECLAAAKKMIDQGVNLALKFAGNDICYFCAVSGNVTSKLGTRAGCTTLVGKNIIVPPSVSSQYSDYGQELIVRVVNRGPSHEVMLQLDDYAPAIATAVVLTGDLTAENTAANASRVAPKPLLTCCTVHDNGTVTGTVPANSYTTITVDER